MSAPEILGRLSDALEGSDGEEVFSLLKQLLAMLEGPTASPDRAAELDEVWMDAHGLVLAAAARSAAAQSAAAALLDAAAEHCTAREVFTLCMATLSQHIDSEERQDSPGSLAVCGPDNPGFQLGMLSTLRACLPRIRRRALPFLADLLNMQLRWANAVLPGLPLGSPVNIDGAFPAAGSSASSSSSQERAASEGDQPLTVWAAVSGLASLAHSVTEWVRSMGGQQLTEQEQGAALAIQGAALLQLASLCVQLPRTQEAATASLAGSQPGPAVGAAPAAGSRVPAMRAAAEAVLTVPQVLLAAVPGTQCRHASACADGGGSGGGEGSSGQRASPEQLRRIADELYVQLATAGVDAAEVVHFAASEAAEGAALAACAAACFGRAAPAQQAQHMQRLLPEAACLLLDLAAQLQSVPLTLLPLCALCTACGQLAAPGSAAQGGPADGNRQLADATAGEGSAASVSSATCQLASSSAAVDAVLSGLVAVMSFNPVQLVRSCAHDAVHAVLDAFQPAARLEQLRRLMQLPSSAAAVVALQRLRQEMVAAWGCLSAAVPTGPEPATSAGGQAASEAGQHLQSAAGQFAAGTAGGEAFYGLADGWTHINAEGDGSSSGSGPRAGQGSQVWVSDAALDLVLPCLQRGGEGGWQDGASVAAAADVQAAALSPLRWVLLRERAAPRGLLPPQRGAALLAEHLVPLLRCVTGLLQAAEQGQQSSAAGGGSGSSAVAERQQDLDSLLALQRLDEALRCVVDLLEQASADVA